MCANVYASKLFLETLDLQVKRDFPSSHLGLTRVRSDTAKQICQFPLFSFPFLTMVLGGRGLLEFIERGTILAIL